jgi:hypothetical protein
MLTPKRVRRDRYGFWLHPLLRRLREGQQITDLEEARDMELCFRSFELDAPDDLLGLYHSVRGDWARAVRAWQPTRPEGAGWFLAAVYDTEDGPYACFARPKASQARVETLYTARGEVAGTAQVLGPASPPDIILWGRRSFKRDEGGRYVEFECSVYIAARP